MHKFTLVVLIIFICIGAIYFFQSTKLVKDDLFLFITSSKTDNDSIEITFQWKNRSLQDISTNHGINSVTVLYDFNTHETHIANVGASEFRVASMEEVYELLSKVDDITWSIIVEDGLLKKTKYRVFMDIETSRTVWLVVNRLSHMLKTGERINVEEVDADIDVDFDSLEFLGNLYVKDKNRALYELSIIKGADPDTFQVIDKNYAKDANNVYFQRFKITKANPQTFELLEPPYSRDDKYVFNGNVPMFVDDIESFKVTKRSGQFSSVGTESFIKNHPQYSFIDPNEVEEVWYSREAKGETKDQKFEGYMEVK